MLKSQQKWKSNHLHKKHQRFEVFRSTMEAALKMRFGLFIVLPILPVIAFVCEVLAAKTDLFHLKVKFLALFIPFRWMKGPENCIALLAKNVQFNEVNDGGSKIFIRISISIARLASYRNYCMFTLFLSFPSISPFFSRFVTLIRTLCCCTKARSIQI